MEQTTDKSVPKEESADSVIRSFLGVIVNPATSKGALLVLAGMFILVAPDASAPIVRLALSAGLILFGFTEIWSAIRHWSDVGFTGVLLALLSILTGTSILFLTDAVGLMLRFVGIYLLLRGLAAGLRLLFRRSRSVVYDVIAAGVQTSLGIMLLFVPEAIAQASIGIIAVGAVSLGGVMVLYGAKSNDVHTDMDAGTLMTISKSWFKRSDLGFERRAEIAEGLYFEAPDKGQKLSSWWTMLGLSVAIATYAILQDSTAVVIGAMLIAPLMTPILGAAGAIVNGRKARLVSSLLMVFLGASAAILLAFIIGNWSPDYIPLDSNTQITSRTSPNVVDMAIALAAGAAGAFATINRRVAGGLAGVAIAVALVPPLGVVGLTLEEGAWSDAWGAFLLFLTNLVAILLSATLIFVLGGWTSIRRLRSNASSIALTTGTVFSAAMVILLPLLFTSQGLISESRNQSTASATVNEWVADNAPELTVARVESVGAEVTIAVAGPQAFPDPASLAAELQDDFDQPVTIKVVLTPTQVTQYDSQSETETQLQ
ncbi:MAG: hypothetical protein CMH41_00430 [Micrococcales bacterium]|nr:hypothetical protein [Micrococcales bacterium]